jgi:threonine/homoserine/homoserine lactone efflux protein
MWTYLVSGIAYGFAAAVTPGPLSMYLLSQAVRHGWRRALPAAFAPLISDGPIAVLVLIVLSAVPPILVNYLRLIGGAFLLYLAFEAWQSWRAFDSENKILEAPNPNRLLKAAIINWLNPNPYFGWSIFLGPAVITGWRLSPPNGIALLVGFYVTIVVAAIGIIVLFAAARTLGPKVRRSLIGLSSMALACLGLYQLWLGRLLLQTIRLIW